ncbi:unnamed protein product, partial [Cladocopium goreaui]
EWDGYSWKDWEDDKSWTSSRSASRSSTKYRPDGPHATSNQQQPIKKGKGKHKGAGKKGAVKGNFQGQNTQAEMASPFQPGEGFAPWAPMDTSQFADQIDVFLGDDDEVNMSCDQVTQAAISNWRDKPWSRRRIRPKHSCLSISVAPLSEVAVSSRDLDSSFDALLLMQTVQMKHDIHTEQETNLLDALGEGQTNTERLIHGDHDPDGLDASSLDDPSPSASSGIQNGLGISMQVLPEQIPTHDVPLQDVTNLVQIDLNKPVVKHRSESKAIEVSAHDSAPQCSFTDEFLEAISAAEEAARMEPQDMPAHDEAALFNLPEAFRVLLDSFAEEEISSPAHLPRTRRVESWFLDHVSFDRCHASRISLLSDDVRTWKLTLTETWRDKIIDNADINFHLVNPETEDAAAGIIGQLVLSQRVTHDLRSAVLSVYDSDPDMERSPHTFALVLPRQANLERLLVTLHLTLDCPPENRRNHCSWWFGRIPIDEAHVVNVHMGHAFRLIISRGVPIDLTSLLNMDDVTLRDTLQRAISPEILIRPVEVHILFHQGLTEDLFAVLITLRGVEPDDLAMSLPNPTLPPRSRPVHDGEFEWIRIEPVEETSDGNEVHAASATWEGDTRWPVRDGDCFDVQITRAFLPADWRPPFAPQESVMQQFEDAQLHIFALQETRLKRQYGILIGLARHRPIGHLYKNGVVQKVFFAQDDAAVVDDLTSLFDAWQTERSPWKSQVRAVAKKHQMQEELENCRAQLVISDQPEFAMDKGALLGDALSDATQQWFCRYFPSGPSEAAKQELIDTWIQILCIDFGENNPLWDNWLAFVFLAWGDHWLPDIIAGFVDGEAEQIVDELYADFATELPRYQVLSRIAFLESSLRHCVETPPAPHRPVQIEHPGLKHPKTNSRVRQPIERAYGSQEYWLQHLREPEELDAWIDCAAKAGAAIRANAQRLPDF